MKDVELIVVSNREMEKEFIQVAVELYANDPNWIRPLDEDIEKIFKKETNKLYENGNAKRWIAKRNGKLIGRVAAFHSDSESFKEDFKTGGIGFFECPDDQEVANLLLDTAIAWCENEGVQVVDGSINFGERNAWWGVLVDGFDPPVYQMNYNPPYYGKLFETYGFQVYFKQFSYGIDIAADKGKKYYERGKRLLANPSYKIEHIKKDNLNKYAEDFRTVYNKAWVKHEGFSGMTKEKSEKLLQTMKPVIAEELIWFCYYNDEPILAFVCIPDLNQYFKHVNGKMNWLGKLKFAYHRWRKNNNQVYAMVFGVVPRFQRLGVEGVVIEVVQKFLIDKTHWRQMELIWVGDFNPKMIAFAKGIGGEVAKTHHTYRYMIDKGIAFERHEMN